jgi:hypothetical protein
MSRLRFAAGALALSGLLVTASAATADVRATEKSLVKFEGMLGRMAGLFGGKAAKEGITSTTAVKGDRKVTTTGDSATIIDLAEEKIYELNLRDRSYRVVTFEEMRRRMQEALSKEHDSAQKREKRDPDAKEMEFEFSSKDTGQKRQIGAYNCREVVLTVTMHEKGKTIDQAGGMVFATDMWLAPRIAGMKEIESFDVRYAKKMIDMLPSAEQMAQAFAMYPGMKEGMAKMQSRQANMDGTAVETTVTIQTVPSKDQAASAKKQDNEGGGGASGIGGMLGRFGRKKEEPKADGSAAKPAADERTTLMTTTRTLVDVSHTVTADEITVPPAFKLKK